MGKRVLIARIHCYRVEEEAAVIEFSKDKK
jgi:hypothetical protein